MCLIFSRRKPNIEQLEEECNHLFEELTIAIGAANSYFSNPRQCIDPSVADIWLEIYRNLIPQAERKHIRLYKKCSIFKELEKKAIVFRKIPGTLKDNILKHNTLVALEMEVASLCESLDLAINEYENYFVNPLEYIDPEKSNLWHVKYNDLKEKTNKSNMERFKKSSKANEIKDKANSFAKISSNIRSNILKHNNLVSLEIECNTYCEELDFALNEERCLFSNPDEYIDISMSEVWPKKYNNLLNKVKNYGFIKYEKCSRGKEIAEKATILLEKSKSLKGRIIIHNNDLANRQIEEGYRLIGDVEGRKLDRQQMFAIVKPSKNHLIIAGAGTGKTTTIIGKIKYLIKKYNYNPGEILVLSFTNASAAEMSERIHKETGLPIVASTFHKLGLEIIKSVEGKVPKIYSKSVSYFVREQLKILMQNPVYLNKLCEYTLYHRSSLRFESDFSTHEEYLDYLKTNAPTTIKGEIVKSYGEMDIANFLFQNHINYEYESSYKFDTNDEQYGQYHPDFYLPDYDIYIEYFGINRAGEVADYFKAKNGESASAAYKSSIEWKRKTHSEKQTTMVECYAYEKFEGNLLSNLDIKLSGLNVELKPLSSKDLWDRISEENNSVFDGIIELFGTIISLLKSNNYSFEYIEQLASNHIDSANNLFILSLIKPICSAYNEALISNNEIDFSDMINKATEYISSGKYYNPFRYVIVDEYQDISKARFNLLRELRKSCFYELFCVGDDWQSIYRFAGSDINYIVDFEKYWGPTEIGRIETTYRFTNSLIDISSGFIMKNPRQIKKKIKGTSADNRFSLGLINGYTMKNAIQFMLDVLDDLPHNSTVFFIGRYSFDVDLLKANSSFNVWYDNANSEIKVSYYKRKDLQIQYLTAHKSKGLQADYVFIINNKNSKMGFPSKIQDASILDLLLEKAEVYPFAEERRLFYVALTRAKTKVFLLTMNNKESVFVQELIGKYEKELKDERFTCPECGGKLIKRSGPYGEFLGCSNFSKTGCKYKRALHPQK